MRVKIYPGKAQGRLAVPPSKSMAHRLLICGALSPGSRIGGVSDSRDVQATLGALTSLGASVQKQGDTVTIGSLPRQGSASLSCLESGSTLRFLIPLCMLRDLPVTLKGAPALIARPLDAYEALAGERGLLFEKGKNFVRVCGPLTGGRFEVAGDKSSQFISGLLFALPLCREDSILTVTGKAESMSYIDLTLGALADFGIGIRREGQTFFIPGGQEYLSRDVTVEGDWSNAAFPAALGYLGGDVTLTGLREDSRQGDKVYPALFRKIGKETVDLSDCPDLAPVLFALAAARGGGKFTGTRRLRYKESDRVDTMRRELSRFGVTLTARENDVTVSGILQAPRTALSGHNDHRVVMALSVLLTLTGGEIDGAEAVGKSYPEFFDDLKKIRIRVETYGI